MQSHTPHGSCSVGCVVPRLLLALGLAATPLLCGCPTEDYGYYLTVDAIGSGTVAPGSGRHEAGTTVTLTATADPGWHLADWAGLGTAAGNVYTIVMDSNRTVGAIFERDQYTLTVSTQGDGSVDVTGGIYDYGDTVTLTATPAQGSHFVRWEGDSASTSETIDVTMDDDKTVSAVFESDQPTLSVRAVGGGTVALAPPGGVYATGTEVTLTATADEGTSYVFIRWEGDASGSALSTTVTMDSDKLVYAIFDTPHTLTISVITGDGSVNASPPPGENGAYATDDVVTLTAVPARGYVFDGWGGDTNWNGTDLTIQVTMDDDKLITVFFAEDTDGVDTTTPKGTATSTFDSSDDAWRVTGDVEHGTGKPDWLSSGGNPGGALSADDDVQGGTWYWQASVNYYGNFSNAYGQALTFDLKQSGTHSQFDNRDVILTGGGTTIWLDSLANPGTDWTSYSIMLDTSEDWRVGSYGGTNTAATEDDIRTVLGALEDLQIRGEYISGADTGGLDNVVLNAD